MLKLNSSCVGDCNGTYLRIRRIGRRKYRRYRRKSIKYLVFYGTEDDLEDGINEISKYDYVVHSHSMGSLNTLFVIMEYVGDESTEVS